MSRTPPTLGFAQALRAIKRESVVDLVPSGAHWAPSHGKWCVADATVSRMIAKGIAVFDDWTEMSDGEQYPTRVRLTMPASQ